MTDAQKDALPKSQRKKLDKRSKAELRKAENAAKEAARLAAAAEARAAKEAGGASAAVEKQGELDALRAERLAVPVSEELKHPYSQRTLIKSLLRAPEEGKSLIGKVVDVGGWVRSVRANGPMFLTCRWVRRRCGAVALAVAVAAMVLRWLVLCGAIARYNALRSGCGTRTCICVVVAVCVSLLLRPPAARAARC